MKNRLYLRQLSLMILMLMVLTSSCIAGNAPKNIIFLIGDGMGIGQVTAGRCEGPGTLGRLAMDTMPFTGFSITHPAKVSGIVTDSAAAGTALATGVKTTNGTISLDPDGNRIKSILELARDMGKATGIVTTKPVTDATPAVFVAHVKNRGMQTDIAAQMIACRPNVILGGGKNLFTPKADGGAREDGLNLLDDAKKRGYDVFYTLDAMNSSTSLRIMGLFAPDIMTSNRPEPTIAEMTSKAVETLSKCSKGFFVMSEGGKIDSCCHGNDAAGEVKELLMFDDAVRAALDFAKKDGNTLVVVTADHETGGLAVQDISPEHPKFSAGWVSKGHSANMVPIYAYGPGAERFTGTHENTDIPRTFAALWGQKLN
ncbi:MAG: alkaline phosphatase [Armatimonadota bacterium]|nr:alkaline phosphatase [bacterium]